MCSQAGHHNLLSQCFPWSIAFVLAAYSEHHAIVNFSFLAYTHRNIGNTYKQCGQKLLVLSKSNAIIPIRGDTSITSLDKLSRTTPWQWQLTENFLGPDDVDRKDSE